MDSRYKTKLIQRKKYNGEQYKNIYGSIAPNETLSQKNRSYDFPVSLGPFQCGKF